MKSRGPTLQSVWRESLARLAPRHAQRACRAARPCLLALLLGVVLSTTAPAATLRLGTPYQTTGGVAVPVWLNPAAQDDVASLQFQFAYDHNDFSITSVAAGPAASGAGKEVIFAGHGDLATVIVAGFNQDILEGGLVATLYLSPNGDAQVLGDIGITGPVFSDPNGEAVPNTISGDDDPDSPGSTPSNPDNDPDETPAAPTDSPVAAPGNVVTNNGNNTGGIPSRIANGAPYDGLDDGRGSGDNAARAAGAPGNNTARPNSGLGFGAHGAIQGYGTGARGKEPAGQQPAGSHLAGSVPNAIGTTPSARVAARAQRNVGNMSTSSPGNASANAGDRARNGPFPGMLASATDGPGHRDLHDRGANDALPMLPRLARDAQRDPAPFLASVCLLVIAASAGWAWLRVARRVRR